MMRGPVMFFVIASAITLVGCPPDAHRPDVICADACKKRQTKCSEHECERGCQFVMDRLVEHEQEAILSCISAANACDDEEWATCAASIGVHADGGPPAPAPKSTE